MNSLLPNGLVCAVYGMTEAVGAVMIQKQNTYRMGSVGKAIEGVQVKLIDNDGKVADIGVDGEILTKSTYPFLGYYGKPADTNIADANGWIHTGDIGRFDEDGYLYVVDRKNDLISTDFSYRRIHVSSSEVANVLSRHRSVAQVCVVPVPYDGLNEVPLALVVKNNKFINDTEQDIEKFAKGLNVASL